MAIQPFGIKVKEKKSKLTLNQVITIILSIVIEASTLSLGWQNNNLQNQNTKLLDKQTNYPIQVFGYPEAGVEGGYVNNTTNPTDADGFLNTTFIISTPDIQRLVIENFSFTPISSAPSNRFFDHSKLNDWWVGAEVQSIGSTFYTNQIGINEINVSIPIKATFYLNPSYDWLGGVSSTDSTVILGNVTVSANLTDMQTYTQMLLSFSTTLWAYVTATERV